LPVEQDDRAAGPPHGPGADFHEVLAWWVHEEIDTPEVRGEEPCHDIPQILSTSLGLELDDVAVVCDRLSNYEIVCFWLLTQLAYSSPPGNVKDKVHKDLKVFPLEILNGSNPVLFAVLVLHSYSLFECLLFRAVKQTQIT
jgi:hypothetical protein